MSQNGSKSNRKLKSFEKINKKDEKSQKDSKKFQGTNIEKLLIKKKELERQLVNVNEEIMLFNKKKKRQK